MENMFAPVLALVSWSLVAMFWMFAQRIPAMQAAGVTPDNATPESLTTLPKSARLSAANYMHLMEQPTLFYAVAVGCIAAGFSDPLQVQLAWAYVILRVVHTFVQNVVQKIMLRFVVFLLASFALIAMVARAWMMLCG